VVAPVLKQDLTILGFLSQQAEDTRHQVVEVELLMGRLLGMREESEMEYGIPHACNVSLDILEYLKGTTTL
jgi:hypothetical protein